MKPSYVLVGTLKFLFLEVEQDYIWHFLAL